MPLSFPSTSHGSVAFGFFNIELDMLLLQDLFFFAHDFCRAGVGVLAWTSIAAAQTDMPGWRLPDREAIGDLQGAMAGEDLGGFIGATYRAFPSPEDEEDFHQNPDGARNRDLARQLIAPFGAAERIAVRREGGQVHIAEYAFTPRAFGMLVKYVDRGGFPRWRDDRRPDYVADLAPLFARATEDETM
jgi:hypothetical protein